MIKKLSYTFFVILKNMSSLLYCSFVCSLRGKLMHVYKNALKYSIWFQSLFISTKKCFSIILYHPVMFLQVNPCLLCKTWSSFQNHLKWFLKVSVVGGYQIDIWYQLFITNESTNNWWYFFILLSVVYACIAPWIIASIGSYDFR